MSLLPFSPSQANGHLYIFASDYANKLGASLYSLDIQAIKDAYYSNAVASYKANVVPAEEPAPQPSPPVPTPEPIPATVPQLNPAPRQGFPLAVNMKEEPDSE